MLFNQHKTLLLSIAIGYFKIVYTSLTKAIQSYKVVGIIDAGGEGELKGGKELKMDAILENFLSGSHGVFAGSKNLLDLDVSIPIAIRGIAKKKVMHKALEIGRDFYYIDTGYFGNAKTKRYHRIT